MRFHSARLLDPLVLVEVFIAGNLAFLAVDIYVAHSMNGFAHWAEWIPFAFSLVAPILFVVATLITGSLRPPLLNRQTNLGRQRIALVLGIVIAAGSIAVGIAGLILHLESQFF